MAHLDPMLVLGVLVAYLGLLFGIAYWAERRGGIRHPAIYTLAISVYCTSWTYYGSVGTAAETGLHFLTIYLGPTLAMILAPYWLEPILRLTHRYGLASIADLLAFRYRSRSVGILVTLVALIGVVPYIALQIRAIGGSMAALTGLDPQAEFSFVITVILVVFSVLFGARHFSMETRQEGLVVAVAFESLVKLVAILVAGGLALVTLGGLDGLDRALVDTGLSETLAVQPGENGQWFTMLLLAFFAFMLLPRQFHMLFTENRDPAHVRSARWGVPLYLWWITLPTVPIAAVGLALGLNLPPDYFVIGLPLATGHPWQALLVLVGGFSASAAMVIVSAVALSTMTMNHLLLPVAFSPARTPDFYRWLLQGKRLLIAFIILLGYLFAQALGSRSGLAAIGLVSFAAILQFVPGMLGVLFWTGATAKGVRWGLTGGMAVWLLTLVVPVLVRSGVLPGGWLEVGLFGLSWLHPEHLFGMVGIDPLSHGVFWSLLVNGGLFWIVSMRDHPTPSEAEAALLCQEERVAPQVVVEGVTSLGEIEGRLAEVLGAEMARQEIEAAQAATGVRAITDPGDTARVRAQLQRQLSGMFGPTIAHMVIDRRLAGTTAPAAIADTIKIIEQRVAQARGNLGDLTGELDRLRRYLDQILGVAPIGVVVLDRSGRITLINESMRQMGWVQGGAVTGRHWREVLPQIAPFLSAELEAVTVSQGSGAAWRGRSAPLPPPEQGRVVVIENVTRERELNRQLRHADRLATIGQMAAGIAHEIGNPLTSIHSLAQNMTEEDDPGFYREGVALIRSESERIAVIVRELLDMSRSDFEPLEPIDLCEAVDQALGLAQIQAKRRGIELRRDPDCPRDMRVLGQRQRLVQVLLNLIGNAAEEVGQGGKVWVAVHRAEGGVSIAVSDNGPGIPDELLERIADPFFTTKSAGQGTGLGLSVALGIVEDHHGRLTWRNRPEGGAVFTVWLPQVAE
ncbi:MAG: histidine kinase [Alphaproteobacteria bacterium CG_4_10_14_0_2_um_filter_63_37]|nr:MAG: histidine kinase [Alphaproteobacteria bacterium CG_4_10_14_0_2_um_filter_63_37]